MEEEIYVPQRQIWFEFVFEKIEIKHFGLSSYFLSNWFRTQGKFILRFLWALIFLVLFTIIFLIDVIYLSISFLIKSLINIIKYVSTWILDILGELLKVIIKRFLTPIIILISLAVCWYLYHIGILQEVGTVINKLIQGT